MKNRKVFAAARQDVRWPGSILVLLLLFQIVNVG
jgi:hypothetical protein